MATAVYVLPGRNTQPETIGSVIFNGKSFNVISASWEGYRLLYRVNRQEVESRLNISILPNQIHWDLGNTYKYSFLNENLYWYCIIEILLLTLIIMILTLTLRFVRNVLFVVSILALLCIATVTVTSWYSPAFFDADLFFQRVVLEEFALQSMKILGLMSLFSAISLALMLPYLGAKLFKLFGVRNRSYWLSMSAILIFLGLIYYVLEYRAYNQSVRQARAILTKLESRLATEPHATIVASLRPHNNSSDSQNKYLVSEIAKKELSEILSECLATTLEHEIMMVIPQSSQSYFYLLCDYKSCHMDTKDLWVDSAEMPSYRKIARMIIDQKDHIGTILEFLSGDYMEGKVLLNADYQSQAFIIVKSTGNNKSVTQVAWSLAVGDDPSL